MKIKKKTMKQLQDQASQIAYFDENEKQTLDRLIHIYKAGAKRK
jgi:hypothetical protein